MLATKRKPSELESNFLFMWRMLNGPAPNCEYEFYPGRKWRFDFAWPDQKIALEIEGGVWSGGRHTRGAGFIADCEKYNTAAAMGWRVFRLTGEMLQVPKLIQIMGAINA